MKEVTHGIPKNVLILLYQKTFLRIENTDIFPARDIIGIKDDFVI